MAEPTPRAPTVSETGTVVVRQRPALLLLKLTLRATEPTLELGFTKLRKQCEQAEAWLKRLDAERVEFGEPHFVEHDLTNQRERRMSSAMRFGQAAAKPINPGREIRSIATAVWPIDSLSPEQVLVLVDRLRFETTESAPSSPTTEESSAWSSPEEQMQERFQEMMMHAMEEHIDSDKPLILFVSRLSEEQRATANTQAFAQSQQAAERLARGMGRSLGSLGFVHTTNTRLTHVNPELMMSRQKCQSALANMSYTLDEHDIVSEDPRPAEFYVSVTATYHLTDEPPPSSS